MAILTVEINRDEDLSALKEFIADRGLKYDIDENEPLIYTDEFKNMLDTRYQEYLDGKAEMVTAEESQKQIKELLATKK